MELFLDKECLSLKEEEYRVERLQGLMKEKISKKAEGFFIDFTRKMMSEISNSIISGSRCK